MSQHSSRLFTISPGAPFLSTFVASFLSGKIIPGVAGAADPLALAAATIYVPTRRSARALALEFARALDCPVILLPKIVPLGHLEEIETGLAFQGGDFEPAFIEELPDAVSETHRRVVLTNLILCWARQLKHAIISIDPDGEPNLLETEPLLVATSPVHAWRLSADLASLIDDMVIEDVHWSALEKLAPESYDQYWKITLDFLKIAAGAWPAELATLEKLDKADRLKRLVAAEIARLNHVVAANPVIAIGSTGANPATARLLHAIARQPRGAVVLPGLDVGLDEAAWRLIAGDPARNVDPADSHPQAVLRRLLRTIGVDRADIVELGTLAAPLRDRARFVGEAMRPADATDAWRIFAGEHASDIPAALAGITIIEATDEREEALCLAIEARRLLERDGATGALITPDRELARRVKGELARWNIEVDDSAGEALSHSSIGALARHIVDAATPGAVAVEILALLSHAHARFGHEPAELQRLTGLLEIGVLRSVVIGGLQSSEVIENVRLEARTRDAHPAAAAISDNDWNALALLLEKISSALAPLQMLSEGGKLVHWIEAHRSTLSSIAGVLPPEEDVIALDDLFEALTETSLPHLTLSVVEYAAFIEAAMAETIVRRTRGSHPRFKILGPLEARLLNPDVFLLGGLDEGIWPPPASADPFLNRPMRAALGLGPHERRIGQTAHDFVQALGATEVVISRARKRGGSPTVPSRFLQRMAAVAGEDTWRMCLQRGDAVRAMAHQIDHKLSPPILRPRPCPPIELRPTKLSVTRIETLRRDPYSIYAERILRLIALAPMGVEPGARETGNLLHELLADLARELPGGVLPANTFDFLSRRAREKFAEMLNAPDFRAFLWPRIEAALEGVVRWENDRRTEIASLEIEQHGKLRLLLADGSAFELTAQADRIERRHDGNLVIIDFKSGQAPSAKEIAAGFAPQLTLEAAMVAEGAFASVRAAPVLDAIYVKILGGDDPKITSAKPKSSPLTELAAEHLSELLVLLNQFRNVQTPYVSRPYPQFLSRFSDYDHLARVKEWSIGGEGSDDT